MGVKLESCPPLKWVPARALRLAALAVCNRMSNSKADLREALREAYDEGDIDLDEWLSSRLSVPLSED